MCDLLKKKKERNSKTQQTNGQSRHFTGNGNGKQYI